MYGIFKDALDKIKKEKGVDIVEDIKKNATKEELDELEEYTKMCDISKQRRIDERHNKKHNERKVTAER